MRPLGAASHTAGNFVRVLVVEPDDRVRSVMNAAFLRQGFQVAAVTCAEDAAHQIEEVAPAPAVVLCDAELPSADGFALCHQLRTQQKSGIPFILLSRTPQDHHPRLASSVGADDYLAMPAFANDLVSLARLLSGGSSSEDVARSSTQQVPLPYLLRALLSGIRSGRLELDEGGQVSFRNGRVLDAARENLRGKEALMRMLLAAEGDYSVAFGSGPVQAAFDFGLEELCTEAFPEVRRWKAQLESSVPLSARLALDFRGLGEVLSELPDGVKSVMRLCDGIRTVRHCILDSPLPENLTLAILTRLHAMEVLAPRDASAVPIDDFGQRPGEAPAKWLIGGDAQQRALLPPRHAPRRVALAIFGVLAIAGGAAWVVARGGAKRSSGSVAAASAPDPRTTARTLQIPPLPSGVGPPEGMLEQGVMLYHQGKPSEAASVLSRAVELEPSSSAWFMLGLARFTSGDEGGAYAAVTQALELDGRNGRALILRAALDLNSNRRERASEALRRYLEVEPGGSYAEEVKRLLASW